MWKRWTEQYACAAAAVAATADAVEVEGVGTGKLIRSTYDDIEADTGIMHCGIIWQWPIGVVVWHYYNFGC